MKLRNVFFTAIACTVLVIAAGADKNNGMSDTSDAGTNGGMMDTMMASGTIQEYNETDSMIVVRTDTATDTFYITQMSQIPSKDLLKKGTQVSINYMTEENRKVIVTMETAEPTSYKASGNSQNKGNGGNGEKMISGTVQAFNESDSMIVITSETGTDTLYFDNKTKMKKDEINEGDMVQVKYKQMNGRKVATKIMKRNGNSSYQ